MGVHERRYEVTLLLIASAIFLVGILSPPSLMDDMDAVQAQMARNMIQSGDWVTPHLDGVVYLEKAPLKTWMTAIAYLIFGVHDWGARLPVALAAILLAWVVMRFGRWAFSPQAGFYAGLVTATCVGLFLFTRALMPDVLVTLAATVATWSFLRALDENERRPRLWAYLLAASLAAGVLLKGLIGAVFPLGAGFLFLLLTRQPFSLRAWRRLYPFTSLAVFLAIAAPWHVLATLRNPPYFDFTMHSGPGVWHGFFWFYFINEQVLRFLNERYPRDYNTVPRLYFWAFHLIWFFPWSAYIPAVARLRYKPVDRAGRARLMALLTIGVVMTFFTFSTTQEYYSMPIYPAVALLIGCAMEAFPKKLGIGTRIVGTVAGVAGAAAVAILIAVRNLPTPGDISRALTQNPDLYTLSLGHMADLTQTAFAYLRTPLALAAAAFLIGAIGAWRFEGERAYLALALMMVVFFQAARLALVTFDPYLSSRPLAEALLRAPQGKLIFDGAYYDFSSIAFYADRNELLLNGRKNNLEYGSYAPGAPTVFPTDADLPRLWAQTDRAYLVANDPEIARLEKLVGRANLHVVAESGGKTLFTNEAITPARGAHAHRD
jgi:4-amino-4-deoxy-L-arabinose transferase-like glycosyltransferase